MSWSLPQDPEPFGGDLSPESSYIEHDGFSAIELWEILSDLSGRAYFYEIESGTASEPPVNHNVRLVNQKLVTIEVDIMMEDAAIVYFYNRRHATRLKLTTFFARTPYFTVHQSVESSTYPIRLMCLINDDEGNYIKLIYNVKERWRISRFTV